LGDDTIVIGNVSLNRFAFGIEQDDTGVSNTLLRICCRPVDDGDVERACGGALLPPPPPQPLSPKVTRRARNRIVSLVIFPMSHLIS